MKNITFSVSLPEERLVSYIERANISYWGAVIAWNPETLDMSVSDDEDEKVVIVNRRHWELAIAVCAEEYHNTFKDIMGGNGDMYTGDILIQLACFGEEKYA